MVVHKGANGVGRDMAKALMEGEDVNCFDRVHISCISMFNSEESVFICGDMTNLNAQWTDDIAGFVLPLKLTL